MSTNNTLFDANVKNMKSVRNDSSGADMNPTKENETKTHTTSPGTNPQEKK